MSGSTELRKASIPSELACYLTSATSYCALDERSDAIRKANVAMMLGYLDGYVDVSEFDPCNFGIGYNELRHLYFDDCHEPAFESNNVHDWEHGEDAYKVFFWKDLTDYEKACVEDMLKQILIQQVTV